MTTKETQTTPDLDKIMVAGLEVFDLPTEKTETAEPGPVDKKAAQEPAPEKRDNQVEAKEKEPENPSSEEKKQTPNFRFSDHTAAEEGYRNLMARTTRAEQENARLRKEKEEREAKEKEEALRAAQDKAIEDYSVQRNEEALAEIENLDPEDSEHSKKVARIWAGANRDIRNFEKNPKVPSQENPAKEKEETEQKPTVTATEKQVPEPEHEKPVVDEPIIDELRQQVAREVQQAGLDPKDPVFSHYASMAPAQTDEGVPMDIGEQVQWAITETKKYQAAQRTRFLQESAQPMGRSGPGRVAGGHLPPKPVTLDDAIRSANEGRRL